jgi:hypothetical protein
MKRKWKMTSYLIALVAEMETVSFRHVFLRDCGAVKMHLGYEKETKELEKKKKMMMMMLRERWKMM